MLAGKGVTDQLLLKDLSELWKVKSANKTYNGTIKMKLDEFKPGICIDYGVEHNNRDPSFSEEVFMIQKIKNTVLWTIDPSGEKIVGTFYEKRIAEDKPKRIQDWENNQEKRLKTVFQMERLWLLVQYLY